ncbi:MAG: NUDIX domain-containing protein [Anaerolineae bacterium]|nr:NUDIX domain-containing protein [Anaerolineae bacterium]
MPTPPYILNIRKKIGHDLLFMAGVTAIVINDANEVLLQRRSDDGRWDMPSGILDPGEEPASAVVREVWEETGVRVIPERIVGVYSGPDYLTHYPNGDEVIYLDVVFACKPISGEPHVNDEESLEVAYFALDKLPPMSGWRMACMQQALRADPRADFRFNGTEDAV